MATFGESLLTVTQSVTSFSEALMQMFFSVIAYLPNIIAAIIILLIGWIIGRLLGKYISLFLDKIGVDDALIKTSVGKAIEQTGTSVVSFFNLIVRWFVYLIALLAAANVLQLEFLTNLLNTFVLYLPNIAAFLIILIAGFILVDYFADFLSGWGKVQQVTMMDPIVLALRVFFYFVVMILALTQLLIDLTIIYIFITPIAWGVGIGLGAAIAIFFYYGLRDHAPTMVGELVGKMKKE
jgi:small-conductance mechanosensitive channel